MANICECAVAIAKEDLAKLGDAITKIDNQGEGSEEMFSYEIMNGDKRHSVKHYIKYDFIGVGNSTSEKYYEVDGEKMGEDIYEERYPREDWFCDYQTHKCLIDKTFSNGWCVNWRTLRSYSYEIPPQVQEYDDHITIFFGGRWSFPESLEEFLNNKEVRWQGAEAECGCEVLNSELGNEDFGLMCYVDKDDEGYDDYYVEDRS